MGYFNYGDPEFARFREQSYLLKPIAEELFDSILANGQTAIHPLAVHARRKIQSIHSHSRTTQAGDRESIRKPKATHWEALALSKESDTKRHRWVQWHYHSKVL